MIVKIDLVDKRNALQNIRLSGHRCQSVWTQDKGKYMFTMLYKAEARAKKATEKAEKALWKKLEDLDIKDRKAEQKAAKKASEENKKKQAAETAKAAKAIALNKNMRRITSFFKAKSSSSPTMPLTGRWRTWTVTASWR